MAYQHKQDIDLMSLLLTPDPDIQRCIKNKVPGSSFPHWPTQIHTLADPFDGVNYLTEKRKQIEYLNFREYQILGTELLAKRLPI